MRIEAHRALIRIIVSRAVYVWPEVASPRAELETELMVSSSSNETSSPLSR